MSLPESWPHRLSGDSAQLDLRIHRDASRGRFRVSIIDLRKNERTCPYSASWAKTTELAAFLEAERWAEAFAARRRKRNRGGGESTHAKKKARVDAKKTRCHAWDDDPDDDPDGDPNGNPDGDPPGGDETLPRLGTRHRHVQHCVGASG